MITRTVLLLLILSLPLLLLPGTAQAQLNFQITLATSGLPTGAGRGPYSLDLQLNGAHASQVTLDHFVFGTGSVSATPTYTGSASGSAATAITLGPTSAGSFINAFDQTFLAGAGSQIAFTLHLTPASGTPDATTDAFIFGVADQSGGVQSTGDNGFEYATLDMPTGQTAFTAGSFRTFSYTSTGLTYTAHVVESVSSTPEPSGGVCLFVFASLFVFLAGRRRWAESRVAPLPTQA